MSTNILWYQILTNKGDAMTLEDRIENLKEQHALIHQECELHPTTELKKKKLALKDEISDLEWADMYGQAECEFG